MAQFETQVPDPLRDDLPRFLSAGCVRTPTIRVLFLILISKDWFKRPTMQVEREHIGRGESVLGQIRKARVRRRRQRG